MTRSDPTKQRYPSFSKLLMVDTVRGKVRVRAWPKPRGRPKSAAVRSQNEWFKSATQKLNHVAPDQMRIAIQAAKGTGFYPRDLLMNAMSGGIIEVVFPDGTVLTSGRRFLEEVMFQGVLLAQDTTTTLPALSTTVIPFPTPVLDTAGFWDAANPTRITIPASVSIAKLSAFFTTDFIVNTGSVVLFFFKNGVEFQRWQGTWSTWPMFGSFTGPLVVSEGDYFEMKMFTSDANRSSGNDRTFFTLEVLQVP